MSDNAKTTVAVALIGAAGAIGAALVPLLLSEKKPPEAQPPAPTIASTPPATAAPAPTVPAPVVEPAPTTKGAAGKAAPATKGVAGKAAGPPAMTKAAMKAAILADEAMLQGRWLVVAEQTPRKSFNPADLSESRPTWAFHEDGLTIRHRVDGKMVVQNQGTFKLRRGGGRRTFDFSGTAGENRPIEFFGIYEFEDEFLKICFRLRRSPNDPVPERPDAFTGVPDHGGFNLRLRRATD